MITLLGSRKTGFPPCWWGPRPHPSPPLQLSWGCSCPPILKRFAVQHYQFGGRVLCDLKQIILDWEFCSCPSSANEPHKQGQVSSPHFFSVPSSKKCWQVLSFLCLYSNFMVATYFTCDNVYCCSVPQTCLTLCDRMDCSPPSSSVHGTPQARKLAWVAISFSRGSFQPRDQTWVSALAGRFFTTEPPGKPSLWWTALLETDMC